jgi:comEA protein
MFRPFIGYLALVAALATTPAPFLVAQTGAARTDTKSTPIVNLNTASLAELQELPGIGARTAQRIVEYREKKGPFKKIEDLMNVQGIGEKSFLKLKPQLTVAAKASGADR